MNRTKREELERVCRGEKDRKVRNGMLAVRMVRVRNLSVEEAVDYLMQCPNWVRNWLRRYDEGGPDGLRDLPRSGRPRRSQTTPSTRSSPGWRVPGSPRRACSGSCTRRRG